MKKFIKDDKVIGTHPMLGGSAKGVVIADDLRGNAPILVKFDVGGADHCVQVDPFGSGMIRHDNTPATIKVVSYLFEDGTATNFKPLDEARNDFGKPAIGAMMAERTADRKYINHEFRSFRDDMIGEQGPIGERYAGSSPDMTGAQAIRIPLDGGEMQSLDGSEISPELRAILDKIFGRKD